MGFIARWFKAHEEKSIIILFSLAFVFLVASVLYFQPPFFNEWAIKLEADTYDRQVRRYHKPLLPNPSIAIVAIDDQSLSQEGRWPWDRAKVAKLTAELTRLGAKVIAFDAVFSEIQENPVNAVLRVIDNVQLSQEIEKIKPKLDSDQMFADALKQQTSILGFAFASNGQESGMLPQPLFSLSEQNADDSLIQNMNGYVGNQPIFQKAANHGAFINTTVDSDGILRFSPLLMREKEKIYPSLALEAAKLYLSLPITGVTLSEAGKHQIVRAVQLGKISIPTDPWGRILIPYRGPPFSFPYLSATDVLQKKIPAESVKDKLIFVGMSATAATDLVATAISPVFAGVEVQASIASGIIDGYLPRKPHWGRGGAILIVVILGVIAAFTFPYIGRLTAFFFSLFVLLAMEGIDYWMWTRHAIALSFFFPAPTLFILFAFELINQYVADVRHKKEIKRIFGQFVPPNYLEELFQKKEEYILTGESKELSILFANVWDFPSLIDSYTAVELKEFLKHYFTLTDQSIFENNGIVDKLNRDEVMAFWGAPLPEPQHSLLAVKSALAIQAKFSQLKPPIPIGIGINTGIVHVGDMGPKFSRNYTAIGRPVDLAQHLKELTKTYSVSILVGESTYNQTKDQFTYRQVAEIQVNGKTEKIYTPSPM